MTRAERFRIPLLLAVATLIPIGALIWLGLRVLQQDRDVERQRRRERIDIVAGRLALDIDRRLQNLEEQLGIGSRVDLPSARFEASNIVGGPGFTPLYQPEGSPGDAMPPAALDAAETEEYRRHDLVAASAAYRRGADSRNRALRASALIGLGRVLRQRGDRAGALQAYADLDRLGSVIIAGQPAALIARQGRCKVFEAADDRDGLRTAAAELARALDAGGWPIDRATFDVYRGMLETWGAPAPSADAVAKTAAAVRLWHGWRRGDLAPRGRELLREEQRPVLAVWAGGPDRPAIWLAAPHELNAWLGPLSNAHRVTISLSDAEGRPVLGDRQTAGGVSLTPAETRLPFILGVRPATVIDEEGSRMRRFILTGGLTIAFLLMLAAAYGLYRTTTREVMLVREQADFVSAVSHEFRTPLTSMRHLTELLVSRGVTNEERKTQYYELLARETERLHRMVESLLSFGRIEAGAYAWRLEAADVGELLIGIVDEFRREPIAEGRRVVCDIEATVPPLAVDREALSRALWNLLENAGKYSEPGTEIRVFARRHGQSVRLGVVDRGFGIAPSERDTIFRKFVRGATAKRAGIRGVGIGLALVKRIVDAHGGAIELESEDGIGSTFTIVLPIAAKDQAGSESPAEAGRDVRDTAVRGVRL